jgi:hypothetical protein
VSTDLLAEVLALVPDEWLLAMNAAVGDRELRVAAGQQPRDAAAWRERYVVQLLARLGGDRPWAAGVVA